MKRTIRTAISLLTFAGVAIFGIADHAPYVGVEEASADKEKDDACVIGCAMAAQKTCGGEKACWSSCMCEQPPRSAICSPRTPCGNKQRCMNGICATPCAADADCADHGGACHVGFCTRRSPEELASCQRACVACQVKMDKCRAVMDRCMSKC